MCFKCDENFTMGHRCARKELRVLMVYEEKEIEIKTEAKEEVEEDPAEFQALSMENLVELSLRSVIGFSTPGTMKVKGQIEDKEVVVPIDCGWNQSSGKRERVV